MEVKVKKSVLFNLLKKRLSENRTYGDNPGGNFVHPFDINDGPIIPDSQMSTQLSTAAPPVEDPEYVPGTTRELRASAERIAQEVPSSEIEYFYRLLHKSLDATLDRAQDQMISEAYTPGGFFDDGQDERYSSTTYDEVDQTDDRFDSEMGAYGAMEDVITDPLFAEVAQKLKEDPYYDLTDDVQRLSDIHGVAYNQIESALQGEYESKSSTTGALATGSTPRSSSRRNTSAGQSNKLTTDLDDDEDLPELSDKEVDSMLSNIADSDADEKLNRSTSLDTRSKVFKESYWDNLISKVQLGELAGLFAVSQSVIDSMDTISRVIGTEYAAKFGYGGAGTEGATTSIGEAGSWKDVLNNEINTNDEVTYRLPIKKKTESFWKPRVFKFINKLGSGSAGALSPISSKFTELVNVSFKEYSEGSGLPLTKFLDQVASRVVESILYDPTYGALTRNLAASESQALSKIIDTGFSLQIKKEPFNIPTRSTFKSRRLDPNSKIEHAGKEKTLRQAIIDAVVAYSIVKSDEFKTESRSLDKELENDARDSAIQEIISGLSDNDSFNFTSGTGKAKSIFTIDKSNIIEDVTSYVDQKFEESNIEDEEELTDEGAADIQSRLEDPSVSESEKKNVLTDEIASRIMQNNDGSASSFRDYDYRVLSKKQKLAFEALRDESADSEDINYVNVYNDIMSELAPSAEKKIKEIESDGLSNEELSQLKKMIPYYSEDQVKTLATDVVRSAASDESGIPAVTRIVYGMPEKIDLSDIDTETDLSNAPTESERGPTRGGETFLQGIEDADLDFLIGSNAAGPNIIRNIVGSIMGKTLRGGGLKKIPDLDFDKINKAIATKVVRSAVQVEKAMLKMMSSEFSGVDLAAAQEASYVTGTDLGISQTKASFLEKNMKDFQIKTIYAFVGRVKRMPNFEKMNPAAKNFVCWFTAIADKRNDGASTLEERTAVAKEIFDKLFAAGDQMINGKKEDVKELTDKVDSGINSAIQTEIEAIKMHSDKTVRDLVKNPKQLRDVIIQAIGMHIQDMSI